MAQMEGGLAAHGELRFHFTIRCFHRMTQWNSFLNSIRAICGQFNAWLK